MEETNHLEYLVNGQEDKLVGFFDYASKKGCKLLEEAWNLHKKEGENEVFSILVTATGNDVGVDEMGEYVTTFHEAFDAYVKLVHPKMSIQTSVNRLEDSIARRNNDDAEVG